MMKKISKIFLRGLIILLPTAVTFYVLYILCSVAERAFGGIVKLAIPDKYYISGMGIIVGAILILILGIMVDFYIFRKIYKKYEQLFNRVPLVKTLYGAIRDLMSLFSGSGKKSFSQVVLLNVNDSGIQMLGFITREEFNDLPREMRDGDRVAVYLPMSYQLGGFTVMVPRERVIPIDMTIEDALKYSITGGIVEKQEKDDQLSL